MKNTLRKESIVLILLLIVFISPGARGQSANMKSGDQLFLLMKYEEAISMYKREPANAEAQWKIARASICLADLAPGEHKKDYITVAEAAARKCIELDNKLSEGHTWLAAALGNKAMFEGSKSKVNLCSQIKEELELSIRLNPKDDLAYSILGTFYRSLANITWIERKLAEVLLGTLPRGGYKDGEIALKKAIALSPGTVRHWYELGKLYDAWGEEAKAKKTFEGGSKLLPQVASDCKRITEMKTYIQDN